MIRGIHYFSAEVKPKLMSAQGAVLSVAGLSGSLLSNMSSWSFMNNLNFVNVSFVVQEIRE